MPKHDRYLLRERVQPAAARGPRERLASEGLSRLSDAELVQLVLGSGIRNKSVESLSVEALDMMDSLRGCPEPRHFEGLHGIGRARACALCAAMELGRRRYQPADLVIHRPGDVHPLVAHYADRRQERFIVLSMNGAHEVISIRVVSIGLLNRTLIHPREVFAESLAERAAAIVVAHSHPSGRLEPSAEDMDITERLVRAGWTLGVSVLDHLIFSREAYWSFLEQKPESLRESSL